jgi:hypothetical protein
VEGGEAAACDDGLEAGLEDGGEEGVVAAEGVADDADVVEIDVAEGFEEIDGADVVPDGFHGAGGVELLVGRSRYTLTPALSQRERGCFLFEVVGFVVAEAGVVGNEADEAALGELVAVVASGRAD